MVYEFRSCCTYFYLVLMMHTVSSVSVNDFYWFGIENGDIARESESFITIFFSNFSITNLLKNENATSTNVRISYRFGLLLQNEKEQSLIYVNPLSKSNGQIYSGDVFYRITDNTTLLNRAKEDIKQSNLTQCDFNPSHLIIVTWINFFYGSSLGAGNTYQVIITTDETSTFAIILFGEINNAFPNEAAHILFTDPEGGLFIKVIEDLFLPYVNDTTQAPNLMFNSNVPGTYIVKLSADVPCSQPPSCPVKVTQECKKYLARLVCQKMIKDNINPIPKACDSL